jgi:hypothetical protein
VLELSLSGVTICEGRPALLKGESMVYSKTSKRITGATSKSSDYIRRHWRKSPATWMGGYVAPAAGDLFDRGGFLLPSYIPPVRSDWIQRLGEQDPTD